MTRLAALAATATLVAASAVQKLSASSRSTKVTALSSSVTRITATSPATNSLSSKARRCWTAPTMISGPMPAGSPMVIAMVGRVMQSFLWF